MCHYLRVRDKNTGLERNYFKNENPYFQIGHGHTVQHVITGLLNGTEQVIQSSNIDAWLLVSP